jgi:hypothetical protein
MPEQAAFFTVFNNIHISGNFSLDNSTQLPTTLVQGYGVLSPDSFQFTREEITEKREVKIEMNTRAQISKLLTFGIYGRDFLKDGGPVTEPPVTEPPSTEPVTEPTTVPETTETDGGISSNAASVSLVLSVAVFLNLRSHY